MKAIQIFEQILIRSDEDILRTLPTEQRLACTICGTVRVSKRDSKKYFCPQCMNKVDVKLITWYYKSETSDPHIAIERHRNFWKGFYFEQLAREGFIKPNFFLLKRLPDFQLLNTAPPGLFDRFLSFLKRKLAQIL